LSSTARARTAHVVANASNREAVAELLERTAPFDCEVFDESDDIALIAIQGRKSLRDPEPGAGIVKMRGSLTPRTTTGQSRPVLRPRRSLPPTGYTGEDGFELYVAPEAAPACVARSPRPARAAAWRPRAPPAATPCA
jgi:aminomethyltransferase